MSTPSMKAVYSSALVAEQRKQYMRTPAERLLMAWVFCWMVLALVATCVMLYLLVIMYRRPVLSSDNFSMLEMNKKLTRETYHSKDPVTQALLKRITAKDINTTLEILIKTPSGGYPLAESVLKYWKSHGMEETKIVKYQALMSIPDETQPNKVELFVNNELKVSAANTEVPVTGVNRAPLPSFLSFSPTADVTAPVVYVNYARTYDFEQLEGRHISVRGKIVITRTGQITKGFKVKNAERAGAAGVVLFLDRVENGPQDLYKAFPDSVYVSGSAIQRGTVSYYRGDPLTPGYPAIDGIHRIPLRDANIPVIPCQPIGYDDATVILKALTEHDCPDDWDPKLDIPCHLAGSDDVKLHVKTHDKLVDGYAYNAIGMIMGGVEPDRYVLMGSHMSWQSRGDANPLLALSQLVVQAKTFANLHKRGWRPRRTMVFALWDGDADSLLGSTEWVEEKMRLLQQGAIIYIANDLITGMFHELGMFSPGPVFKPQASPSLSSALRHVTELIKIHDKNKNTTTLLDRWISDGEPPSGTKGPKAMPLTGRSDDASFAFAAGVPSMYIFFAHSNMTGVYPAYHTMYDNMGMIKLLDPGWKTSQMAAKTSALLARLWADRVVLPYDLNEMAEFVTEAFQYFTQRHSHSIESHRLNLDGLKQACNMLSSNARVFQDWANGISKNNPMVVRIANDIMMQVERIFITPKGIPSRHVTHRHLLYSSDGMPFPGMEDQIMAHPFNSHLFHLQLALLTESVWQAAELLVVSPY